MPLGQQQIRRPRQAPNAPRENTQLLAGLAGAPTRLPTQTVTAPQPTRLPTQTVTPGGSGGTGGASQLATGALTPPKVQRRGGVAATGAGPASVRPAVTPATGNGASRPAASARGAAATAAAVPAAGAANQLAAGALPGYTRLRQTRWSAKATADRGPPAQAAAPQQPGFFGSAARTIARSLPNIGPIVQGADIARSVQQAPPITDAASAGRVARGVLIESGDAARNDIVRSARPVGEFAGGLTGLDGGAPPPAGRTAVAPSAQAPAADGQAGTAAAGQPGSQLAAGAATSVPGIVRFEGADGVPIYTNRPTETAAELAGNDGRLRYGVTSVPTVVPAPGVAMSEATGVTPTTGQRTRPAEGYTAADRLTQLAGMAMRSNNYAAGQAADRNAGLIRDARSAAQAGRTGEATQLAQLAQIAGQQAPQAGAVGLPPGLALGAIDRDARFADRARIAAELRGTQLANEGTALANRGAALTQQQLEEQAALTQDLLSGDETRSNTAAERFARLNALTAKPEKPVTAEVSTETGTDQYVVDPRTGDIRFNPNTQRAIEQARQAVIAAEGDEKSIAEIEQQLMKSHGVNLRGQPVQ